MTEAELKLCAALVGEPGQSVRQLAERVQLARSHTHRTLQSLARRGFVTLGKDGYYPLVGDAELTCPPVPGPDLGGDTEAL